MLGLVGALPANAQDVVNKPVTHQFSIDLSTTVPTADFGPAVGGGMSYGYNLFGLPVYAGGDLDIATYGSASTQFIGETTLNVRGWMFQPQASIRYQPVSGQFRPFVEGLAGFNILTTSTSISGDGQNQDTSREEFDGDAASTIGIGAGVDYRYTQIAGDAFGFTVSVQYLYGGQAEIPTISDDPFGVNPLNDNTTAIQVEIGFYGNK